MFSNQHILYFSSLVKLYFSETCSEFFKIIYINGPLTLLSFHRLIKEQCKIAKISETKYFLSFLLYNQIIKYNGETYTINDSYVLFLSRINMFLYHSAKNFNKMECEILNFLAKHGQSTIEHLKNNFKELNLNELKTAFLNLARNNYIGTRVIFNRENSNLTNFTNLAFNVSQDDMNTLVERSIDTSSELVSANKKLRSSTCRTRSLWCLNPNKLTSIVLADMLSSAFYYKYIVFYNQLINSSFTKVTIQNVETFTQILRYILENVDFTAICNGQNPSTYLEIDPLNIERAYGPDIKKEFIHCLDFCAQHETLMRHQQSAQTKVADPLKMTTSHREKAWISHARDDMYYKFNVKVALLDVFEQFVHQFIQQQYGVKSARIYGLIQSLGLCEQKTIEDCAMMPAKEVKEHLYSLLDSKFLNILEISKANDFAPSRTFYLFQPSTMYHTALAIQTYLYKISQNLLERSEHEHRRSKHLLEKREKIEAIVSNLPGPEINENYEEQVADIRSSLLPSEHAILQEVQLAQEKIECAKYYINQMLILTETVALLTIKIH